MKRQNYQGGQVVIISVVFLLLIGLAFVARAANSVRTDAVLARNLFSSKKASALSDAGIEDLVYRIRRALTYDSTEFVPLNDTFATTTVASNPSATQKIVKAVGTIASHTRQKGIILFKGVEVDFSYAIQAGNGGFTMANISSVIGNVYSNGSITASGNYVYGSVVSAGPDGLLDNVHATSSAWAHTIQNSTIDKDAYYKIKTNTTVGGQSWPNSDDKATSSFPISDAQIEQWEIEAEAGGTYSGTCPYNIKSSVTLGPIKIPCNVEISNNSDVAIAGPVWIVGDISFKNNSGIRLASELGASSVALITDNPSDRLNSSKVEISNSTVFSDSGTPGSFLFLISANRSKEDGGSVTAIDLKNTASGAVVLYSNHGSVSIGNSSQLRSVAGYLISMKNSAQLIYEDGLESSLFDTGPGGSWNFTEWKETQ